MSALPVSEIDTLQRSRVQEEALRWLGTPYCHQASMRGSGADCLGLVIGVWNAISGQSLALPRQDQRSWAAQADGEPLLDGLGKFLWPSDHQRAQPADILVLRWRRNWPASHLAILMHDETIVHAYEGGKVVRSQLAPWAHHVVAAFSYPHPTNLKPHL